MTVDVKADDVDPEGGALTVTEIVTPALNGQCIITDDNQVRFEPALDFDGYVSVI